MCMARRLCFAALFMVCACPGSSNPPPPPPPQTWSISGTITGAAVSGVTLTLSGAASASKVSTAAGAYTFDSLKDGAYTVTPALGGYTFAPPSSQVTVAGKDMTGIDFVATAVAPPPPGAPSAVTATPTNGGVTVTWASVSGASGYNLYYSATPPVTTASTKIAAASSPATVTGLANGSAYSFAVTAVGEGGESALSASPCAVPTAGATSGLTLYDPLCGSTVDGALWQSPGAFSTGVEGGAAVLSVATSNQEARSVRNLQYGPALTVNAAGHRVTTIAADIEVPAAGLSRTGSVEDRASVRLLYTPPLARLSWPGGSKDLISFEVGLLQNASGLHFFRATLHCDDAACASPSADKIAVDDPAGLVALDAESIKMGAPAATDKIYRVTATFDETEGKFHWTIANETFGAGLSGSANPSAYLAATTAWQSVSLASTGFQAAQISTRTLDPSTAGHGSGQITAKFRNVSVGFDNNAATAFDDFSGAGGNSGPVHLSPAKWGAAGGTGVAMDSGSALIRLGATSTATNSVSIGAGLTVSDPASIDTLQADLRVPAFVSGSSNNAFIQGTFYNTGTAGTTAPDINQPNSAVGDILASIFLQATTDTVNFSVLRMETAIAGLGTQIAYGAIPGVSVGTGVHTVRIAWNAGAHTFTFTADGQAVTINPTVAGGAVTVAAPVVSAAHWPMKRVFGSLGLPVSATGSTSVRANNVYVGP